MAKTKTVIGWGELGKLIREGPPKKRPVKPRANKTLSEAEKHARAMLSKATKAWRELDTVGVEGWRKYAADQRKRNVSANNLFVQHYVRLLRLNPDAPVPIDPPTKKFLGPWHEGISAEGCKQLGDARPLDIVAPSGRAMAGFGLVLFTSAEATEPGIAAELLLKRVKCADTAYEPEDLRSVGYFHFRRKATALPLFDFIEGEDPYADRLCVAVPVSPGWYACGYRYVCEETGQATRPRRAGIVRVP